MVSAGGVGGFLQLQGLLGGAPRALPHRPHPLSPLRALPYPLGSAESLQALAWPCPPMEGLPSYWKSKGGRSSKSRGFRSENRPGQCGSVDRAWPADCRAPGPIPVRAHAGCGLEPRGGMQEAVDHDFLTVASLSLPLRSSLKSIEVYLQNKGGAGEAGLGALGSLFGAYSDVNAALSGRRT